MHRSIVRSFEVVVERSHMPVSKLRLASPARCGRSNGLHGLDLLIRHQPKKLRARSALTEARRGGGRQRRTSCGHLGANSASLAIVLSWIPSGPLTYARFSSTSMSSTCLMSISMPSIATTASPISSEAVVTTLERSKESAAACGSRYGTRRGIAASKPPRNDVTAAAIGRCGEKAAAATRTDRPRRRRGRSRGPRDGDCDEDRGQPSTARTAAPVGLWTTTAAAPPPSSHFDDATNSVFVLLIDAAGGLYELLAVTHSGQSDRATAGDCIAAAMKESTLSSAQSTTVACSSCFRMRTSASRVRVLTKRVSNSGSSSSSFVERAVWGLHTPSSVMQPGEVLVGIPAGQSAAKALHLARKVLFKSPAVASILTQPGPRSKASSARTIGSGSEGASKVIPPTGTPSVADPLMCYPRNALPPRPSRASRPPLCPRKPGFVEAPTKVLQDMRHGRPGGRRPRSLPCDAGDDDKENRPTINGSIRKTY
jgi:hypothetical protein